MIAPRDKSRSVVDVTEASVPVVLAELDAEVERSFSGTFSTACAQTLPVESDDQATRLRALVEGADGSHLLGSSPRFAPAFVDPLQSDRQVQIRERRDDAPFTIAVASGKGGVGKTNITMNLAAVLASMGYRVTVLDADLGTANADVLCGLTPSARLDHVLTPGGMACGDGAHRSLRDILLDAPGGFRLLPGSAGISRMADLSAAERRRLFDELAEIDHDTDVLLIDTAAGVGRSVTAFLDAADICLVVATPEPTAITDAYALIKCASSTEMRSQNLPEHSAKIPRPLFRIIVNQAQDQQEARRVFTRLRAVSTRFLGVELALAGWIAQDVRVPEAVRARCLFALRSPTSEASRNISAVAELLAQDLGPVPRVVRSNEPPRRLASALRRFLGMG